MQGVGLIGLSVGALVYQFCNILSSKEWVDLQTAISAVHKSSSLQLLTGFAEWNLLKLTLELQKICG